MKDVLLLSAMKLNRKRKQRKGWQMVVRTLAVCVVFCTTYALILPAITIQADPVCGFEEHVHTDSCYQQSASVSLGCTPAAEAIVVHKHNELCLNDAGELICTLPEISVHTHEEGCYSQADELACSVTHVHSEACVQTQQQLICELPEEAAHAHNESCTFTQSVLICTDETHVHGEECYEAQTTVCELAETEGHTHGESCYAVTEVPCTEPTAEEHIHGEACYQQVNQLTCTLQELQLHTHEDACYDAEGTLICTLPVVVEHIHDESCLVTSEQTEPVLICELQEHVHVPECYPVEEEPVIGTEYFCGYSIHTHNENCYAADGTMTCTIPEHTHNPLCAVEEIDLSADVEAQEQWEESLASLSLSGYWPADLLSVAETQLGYAESEKNLILAEDNSLKGYTRYGSWYGEPYGDWNAMFAAFCLHYAGADAFPVTQDYDQWIDDLTEQDLYCSANQYVPKIGDLVFVASQQDSEEGETAASVNYVGILAELIAPAEDTPGQFKLIAGDIQNQVCYLTLDWNDPLIIGYGCLPDADAGKFVCGQTNHEHSWICVDEAGTWICLQPEHTHTGACCEQELTFDNGTIRVVMTISGAANLPEDLTMQVIAVTSEDNHDAYSAMVSAVGETMATSSYYVDDAIFYRIVLQSDGTTYDLPETAKTSVQVTMQHPAFTPEEIASSAGLRTFTLTQEEVTDESTEAVEEASVEAEEETGVLFFFTELVNKPLFASSEAADSDSANVIYQAVESEFDSSEDYQISFTYENAMTFGVALTDVTSTTGYWKRVSSTDELASGGDFLIVSAEGNYALSNTGSGTKVYIDSIKDNTDYYHITLSNAVDGDTIDLPAAYWNFSGSGNSFTVTSKADTSKFINLYRDRTSEMISTGTKDALSVRYQSSDGCWILSDAGRNNNTYYLTNTGTTTFSCPNNGSANARSMLIFKNVNESLNIPNDVISTPNIGADGKPPEKPEYDDYITPSGSKTGETSHPVDEELVLKGSYFSDPATSMLESQFNLSTVTAQLENDGRVLSDKSVIYGDDDYNAFSSYDPNTFGVTLSALGQEFATGSNEVIHIPVDVMFILDISGSMNSEKVPNSDDSRSKAMVEAVNTTIKEIMDRNPQNRVGAVLFSSGTGELLDLGRYTENNNQFLEMRNGGWTATGGSNYSFSGDFIYPNDSGSLRKDGALYTKNNVYPYQFNGTYTQAGIAMGAQKLMEVQDTTCDVTIFKGTENETTVKVRRQPVIILLSDGEPTHSTSNYKDVLNGPHYGDGLASSNEYRGVHGYYTILSANYYKRMVGIHYNQPAQFYTVGMGINATGKEPASTSDDAYYKRAVLDPTVDRVNTANSSSSRNNNAANTSQQLYQLLNSSYNGSTITVTTGSQDWMPEWIGQVHASVPVIKNPYANDYSYATGAYFGNYNAATLASTFGQILDATEAVSEFGFILRSRTSLNMEDPIGQGMEVKGAPVLRYGGKNYTATSVSTSEDGTTVTYVYNHFYQSSDGSGYTADLSKVRVRIVTDSSGLQTVYMDVPDYILPAYSPYIKGVTENNPPIFYYEALPIRLIYQVGLTAESEAALNDLYHYGGDAVYYTNRYTNDIASATLLPTNDNPYYTENASSDGLHENCHHSDKSENTTSTLSTFFECHHALVDHPGETDKVPEVTQKLGNNGKLVFSEERKSIVIPVEKVWHSDVPEHKQVPVEVELYSVVGNTVTLVKALELNAENGWKARFDKLPLLEEGFYAIRENVPEEFAASYSGELVTITIDGKPEKAVKIQAQIPQDEEPVLVSNSGAYVLPNTGGMGTSPITFGGLLMIAAALMYFTRFGRIQKKGGARSDK